MSAIASIGARGDLMRLVVCESPFAGPDDATVAHSIEYAHACLKDCLDRGEAPFASHLLYTAVLDDRDELQRATGIDAGFAWAVAADARVIYTDLGISRGMQAGIEHARAIGQDIEYRTVQGWVR